MSSRSNLYLRSASVSSDVSSVQRQTSPILKAAVSAIYGCYLGTLFSDKLTLKFLCPPGSERDSSIIDFNGRLQKTAISSYSHSPRRMIDQPQTDRQTDGRTDSLVVCGHIKPAVGRFIVSLGPPLLLIGQISRRLIGRVSLYDGNTEWPHPKSATPLLVCVVAL